MCLVCTVCSLLYIEGRCFSVFGIVLELENINRAAPLFRVHGAGVAEHGQTRTNHERGLMRGTQDPVSQEYVSSNLTPCTIISKLPNVVMDEKGNSRVSIRYADSLNHFWRFPLSRQRWKFGYDFWAYVLAIT
jgi:hypothetical protein